MENPFELCREVLDAYEAFETHLILENSAWENNNNPCFTDELYDEFMACQEIRNQAKAALQGNAIEPTKWQKVVIDLLATLDTYRDLPGNYANRSLMKLCLSRLAKMVDFQFEAWKFVDRLP